MPDWTNWSKGVRARPAATAMPGDEAALQSLLRGGEGEVRVTGSGHSFTPLCATKGTLLSLDRIAGVIGHDAAAQTARLHGGTKIHAIGLPLHERGLALINQGDIDRQSIAGAVSTGTHGTGLALGSLSSELTALRLVTADGGVIEASAGHEGEIFAAGRVALGTFGVISALTIKARTPYKLAERGWVAPVDDIMRDLDKLSRATRHFEFWWFPYADAVIAKSLAETDAPAKKLRTGEEMAAGGRIDGEQLAFQRFCEFGRWVPFASPWINREITKAAASGFSRYADSAAPVRFSHEAFPSPRLVRFNEMEFSVPAERGADCAREICEMIRKKRIAVCFPIEFRFVAADDIWLSPFYGRDSVSISVHQYFKQSYRRLFDACEAIFRAHGGRPHWGKLHTHGPDDFARLYPRWDDFRALRRRLDPRGRFLNDHLRAIFGA